MEGLSAILVYVGIGNPTDRGQQGTKRHLVVDAHGIPLAALVSAANVQSAA